MTFGAWLRQHKHAQSAIGELARDALSDPARPRTLRHKQAWDRYLRTLNACEAVLDTFQCAWETYGRDTGSHITDRLQALDTPSFRPGYLVRSTEEGCSGCGKPWAAVASYRSVTGQASRLSPVQPEKY